MTAVEPPAEMRARRAPGLPAAIDAVAASLPFDDDAFDASMTTFSIHEWPDLDAGLREMRRVTRGPVAAHPTGGAGVTLAPPRTRSDPCNSSTST